MRIERVPTLAGEMEIQLPTSKKEITLAQHIEFSKYKMEENLILQEIEEAKFRMDIEDTLDDDPDTVYSAAHFNVDKAKAVRKLEEIYSEIIRSVVPPDDSYIVDLLPHKTLQALAHSISVEAETPSLSYFFFPEGTKPDIERLDQEKHNLLLFYAKENEKREKANKEPMEISLEDKKIIHDIDQKIEVLTEGKFMAIPAERILFETRIQVDTINRKLPEIPSSVKKELDKKDISLDTYIQDLIHWEDLETLSEKQERFKLEKELKKYLREYETGMYDRAARIMSHVCVPEGTTYSYNHAEARVKHFYNLDLYTVDSVLGFFLDLREILTNDTALSLMKKENLKLRKHRNM